MRDLVLSAPLEEQTLFITLVSQVIFQTELGLRRNRLPYDRNLEHKEELILAYKTIVGKSYPFENYYCKPHKFLSERPKFLEVYEELKMT